MLIRRRVIQTPPTEVENHVTVVRPRQPTGLLFGLGIATLFAVGIVTYLSWALPQQEIANAPAEVTAPVTTSSRPERFHSASDTNRKPTTIIVNPAPVIQTAPPVVNVTPPSKTTVIPAPQNPVIVQGTSSNVDDDDRASANADKKPNQKSKDQNNSGDTGDNGDTNSADDTPPVHSSGE